MSNVYWKNVLNQSIDESELLRDFEQLSFKIDDYYKSFSLSEDVSKFSSVTRSQAKALTSIANKPVDAKESIKKRPSLKEKTSFRPGDSLGSRSSFHQRTQTLHVAGDKSRKSYPYSRQGSANQSKQTLFKGL